MPEVSAAETAGARWLEKLRSGVKWGESRYCEAKLRTGLHRQS